MKSVARNFSTIQSLEGINLSTQGRSPLNVTYVGKSSLLILTSKLILELIPERNHTFVVIPVAIKDSLKALT